jgi:hypothetical protein
LGSWTFREAEQRFLLLFLEKEDHFAKNSFAGGMPPDPLGRLHRGLGSWAFREAEQRFLLLLLEKKNTPVLGVF